MNEPWQAAERETKGAEGKFWFHRATTETGANTGMGEVPRRRGGKPLVDRPSWPPRGNARRVCIFVGKTCVRTRRARPPRHYIYDKKYT